MSVAAISSSAAAAASRSRSNAIPSQHPGRRLQRQVERVDRVEQVLLVLLHVLVVGQREPVQHAVQRRQPRHDPRRLGAQQLGRVGVLLLRHDRGARRPRVGDLAEAELVRRPQHDLGAEPREVRRARRRRGEEVEHEVAVGDGVDRVRGDRGEAELARDEAAVGREVHAGQRARAERQLAGRAEHELEPPRVAPEHPEVRQQVVREVDRLRALEVRVAGHRPVLVALGELDERALQLLQLLERLQRVRAREHRHVGRDLVVARARGVELAADRADDLRQPPLDRHVDVLVVLAERERAAVELLLDALEPAEQRVAVGLADDPRLGQHRRVRARLLDVVRPEPPVEADRRVELAEDRVLGLREARHSEHHAANGRRRAHRPPGRPRARAAVRLRGALLHRLRGRRAARAAAAARALPARGAHGELGHLPRRRGRRRAGRRDGGVPVRRRRRAGAPLRAADAAALAAVARTGALPPPARDRRRLPAPAARHALRRRARDRIRRTAAAASRPRCSTTPRRSRARAGLAGVALDTGIENRAARALYERYGFVQRGLRPAPDERTARAVGGSGFVGYLKPR